MTVLMVGNLRRGGGGWVRKVKKVEEGRCGDYRDIIIFGCLSNRVEVVSFWEVIFEELFLVLYLTVNLF